MIERSEIPSGIKSEYIERRGKIAAVNAVLGLCAIRPIIISRIHSICNFYSYEKTKFVVGLCVRKKLLDTRVVGKNTVFYFTTDVGRDFVKKYRELMMLLKDMEAE